MNLAEVGVGVAMGQALENQGGSGHRLGTGTGSLGKWSLSPLLPWVPDLHCGGRGNQEVGMPHSVPDAATSHLCLIPYNECVSSWQSDK